MRPKIVAEVNYAEIEQPGIGNHQFVGAGLEHKK
jgi:hypothetical protein